MHNVPFTIFLIFDTFVLEYGKMQVNSTNSIREIEKKNNVREEGVDLKLIFLGGCIVYRFPWTYAPWGAKGLNE